MPVPWRVARYTTYPFLWLTFLSHAEYLFRRDRLLVQFDDPARYPIRGEWALDDENFYFTLTEYESDVWVMELDVEGESARP